MRKTALALAFVLLALPVTSAYYFVGYNYGYYPGAVYPVGFHYNYAYHYPAYPRFYYPSFYGYPLTTRFHPYYYPRFYHYSYFDMPYYHGRYGDFYTSNYGRRNGLGVTTNRYVGVGYGGYW